MTLDKVTIINVIKFLKNISITTVNYVANVIINIKGRGTGTPNKWEHGETVGSISNPVYISNGVVLPTNKPLLQSAKTESNNRVGIENTYIKANKIGGSFVFSSGAREYEILSGLNIDRACVWRENFYSGDGSNICSNDPGFGIKIIDVIGNSYSTDPIILTSLGMPTNNTGSIYYVINRSQQNVICRRSNSVITSGYTGFYYSSNGGDAVTIKPNEAAKFIQSNNWLYIYK